MSYAGLLTDRCQVYHLKQRSRPSLYGIPSEPEYDYDAQPDLFDVPSYWTLRGSGDVVQGEPHAKVVESYLVHFDKSVDIRLNDRVIFNGSSFTLRIPRNIRNHHWEVVAVREEML